MSDTHHCQGFNPQMNDGWRIVKHWFGWCLEKGNAEFRINFCPLCGVDLQKEIRRQSKGI
jgi:hypothetical protein